MADIQAACSQAKLLVACRVNGSPNLQVLANAPRADVFFDTGSSNTPHDANGVGWYFNENYSWGFAPPGATLNRIPCDVEPGSTRLCWNSTDSGVLDWGFRCGDNAYFDDTYERMVFQAP